MLKKLVRKVKLAVGITFISILPNADGCVETLKEILAVQRKVAQDGASHPHSRGKNAVRTAQISDLALYC